MDEVCNTDQNKPQLLQTDSGDSQIITQTLTRRPPFACPVSKAPRMQSNDEGQKCSYGGRGLKSMAELVF